MADPPAPSTTAPDDEGEAQVHIGHVDLALAVLKWAGNGGSDGIRAVGDGADVGSSTPSPFPPPPPGLAATPLYLERGAGGKTVLASEDG
jgi:hypothetical protein